jgi:hypothetical protein
VRSLGRRFIKRFLANRGYELVRIQSPLPRMFEQKGPFEALTRWKGTPIATVIDTGASDGRWSEAVMVLKQTQLIVVEAYNFTLVGGCLRFHELCAFLEERGFRCLDLFDVMHRPGDGVLWQMDLIFAPAGRAEFGNNSFL